MGKLCKGGVTAAFCTPTGIEVKDRPCSEPRAGFCPQNHRDVQFCIKLTWLVQPQRESGVVGSRTWISNSSSFPVFTRSEHSFSFICPNSFLHLQSTPCSFCKCRVCLSMLKIKFRLLFLDMCDLWECLPGTNSFLLFFSSENFSVKMCLHSYFGIFHIYIRNGKKRRRNRAR